MTDTRSSRRCAFKSRSSNRHLQCGLLAKRCSRYLPPIRGAGSSPGSCRGPHHYWNYWVSESQQRRRWCLEILGRSGAFNIDRRLVVGLFLAGFANQSDPRADSRPTVVAPTSAATAMFPLRQNSLRHKLTKGTCFRHSSRTEFNRLEVRDIRKIRRAWWLRRSTLRHCVFHYFS
jgi:hypothetical protein